MKFIWGKGFLIAFKNAQPKTAAGNNLSTGQLWRKNAFQASVGVLTPGM